GLEQGMFIGLSVARLEANKGLPYLLRALRRMPPEIEWRWVILGSGTDRAALQGEAAGLGISERVIFAGSLPDADLHNLYELFDLFGHSTLYEGSSLVTLEAMSHGLPVIASAVGGIPDKVIEGETGFLVSPGDTSQLAARIAELATRPGERRALGERGAARVEAEFSWRSIAAQTELLLRRLIDVRQACRSKEV
ncbi:MAG TPA: glycosyltransferase family 4 protein, partial [Chloroflexia bacterium]|nr:glycosyltransferase family 4 protein [Chloroflexia bacterium]